MGSKKQAIKKKIVSSNGTKNSDILKELQAINKNLEFMKEKLETIEGHYEDSNELLTEMLEELKDFAPDEFEENTEQVN